MRTLDSYLKEARVMILKWGQPYMTRDDQIVGNVARAIMRAENNYSPSHNSGAAIGTLRVTYARNEILNTFRKYRSIARRGVHISLNAEHDFGRSGSPFTFAETLEDRSEHFIETIINEDTLKETKTKVRYMLEDSYLSIKQRRYLKAKYVEGLSSKQIAERFNVSKQAVSEGLLKGISKLKEVLAA